MPKDQTVLADCPKCGAHTEATLHGSFDYSPGRDEPGGRYGIARCKRCSSPLLIQQENFGSMAEGDAWGSAIRLYPSPSFRVNPAAPEAVQLSLAEAVACHEARAHTAAAIMCRRAVEGLCAAHKVKERNLAKSLAKLRDLGVIDQHLFDWADMLRVAGNDAAHDVSSRVGPEDARDMLEFTGAIVDYVFSFRDKFIAFKERRATRGASRGTGVSGSAGDGAPEPAAQAVVHVAEETK